MCKKCTSYLKYNVKNKIVLYDTGVFSITAHLPPFSYNNSIHGEQL